jgi:hypothetical protein
MLICLLIGLKINNSYLRIRNMNLTNKNAGLYSYMVSKGSTCCLVVNLHAVVVILGANTVNS